MALYVPDSGEQLFLEALLDNTDLHAHLVVADWTPSDSDTPGTFTECTATDYAAITLDHSSPGWVISGGSAEYDDQIEFAFTSACDVYGYYITNTADDTLVWAEKLPSPLSFGSDGGSVLLTPAITAN